ncbi:nucleoside hydrolase [Pseudactinotalea terrae]|uniref:nucleoside hydrolase n=1 Tax=Pseudactinotalea terrae TaxID=1743262 RepID=UPI0012E3073D|nr:nucleoside hydrolase [Pseudactinotalea terrae]
MPEVRPVVVDCDPGLDDAVALAMVVASPELDLIGVTTLAGNASLAHTTANAGALLELLGLPAELPFHTGHAGPLARVQREPDEPIHGPGGMGDIELPAPRQPRPGHAVDWLAETIRERPGEVTIIAIGPLTNVAGLLLHHPDVAPLIGDVVVMGGAAFVQGNLTARAEFNFHADPEAARYVAESGVPLRIVPLDVTRRALVTGEDIDRLRAAGGIAALMGDMLAYLARGFERRHGIRACAVHDALAVAALLEPELMVWEHAAITVECSGEFTRGELIVDTHGRLGREPSAAVATGIDAERFRTLMHRRLTAVSH